MYWLLNNERFKMVIDLTKNNSTASIKNIDEDIALQYYKKLNLDHSSPSQEALTDSDWLVRYCHFTQEDRRLMNISYRMTAGVSIGRYAMLVNTTGSNNVAMGNFSLDALTTGSNNTAVGYSALTSNTTGFYNTAFGSDAGLSITTGVGNTMVGTFAADNATTGNYNTSLGYGAKPSSATVGGEFTLGDTNVNNLRCNDTTISSLSDQRDKTEIVDNPYGLEFLKSIQSRKFTWATREGNVKDGSTRLGFIAQELLAATDGDNDVLDLVYESNPDRLEAKAGNLIPILVKAIQELAAEVQELKDNR